MNRLEFYKEKYRQLKPSWRDSQAIYADIINGFVDSNTKILDVGCGYGYFMKAVYKKTDFTYGIDLDENALKQNKIIKNKICGTVEKLLFSDSYFDLVISAWTLEHLKDPVKAFKEIFRVLKPGGKVIFLTPNIWNYNICIIRMIPEKFHSFLTRKLYNRKDVFPKFYKINSAKQIDKTLVPIGFKKVNLILNGDPSYISFNRVLFGLACFLENILDKKFNFAKAHLIGVYEK